MILAIGNSGVYELDAFQAVFDELEQRGHSAVLFKQDRCLESDLIRYETRGDQYTSIITIDGKDYDIAKFSAIWYMKPHLPKELLEFQPPEYRQLIHKQFFTLRESLWSIFENKIWVNNPWAVYRAENKPYQSKVALDFGLHMPDTVITSDPDAVRRFYDDHPKGIVVKLLSASPMIGKVIYTNLVTPEYMKSIASVKRSPAIFQAVVKKKHELRITVVGKEVFPVKIYSQEDEATTLDWRKKPKFNDFEVRMEPTDIPEALKRTIHNYMSALNLRYGSLDFIVTPEDNYVFLEINPNGQWYFVQLNTGLRIAKAIANLLV